MRSWVVESVAPEVLEQNVRAWRGVLATARAEWKFAPASGFDFFRACGWSPTVTRSCVSEARRLGREDMRYAFLLRALSALSARFRNRLERAVVYGVLQPSS